MKNFLKTVLAALVISSLLIVSACKPATLEKAYKASAQIASYTERAAIAVGDLYDYGVITYDQKERIAAKLRLIVTNGKRFHNTVKSIAEQTKNNPSANDFSALDVMFNDEVIKLLSELVTEIGLLSKDRAKLVFAAIAVLRQLILTIAGGFAELAPVYKLESQSAEFYRKEANASG